MGDDSQVVSPITLLRCVQQSYPNLEERRVHCAGEFIDALATTLKNNFELLEICSPSFAHKVPFAMKLSRTSKCVGCGQKANNDEAIMMVNLPFRNELQQSIAESRKAKIGDGPSCQKCRSVQSESSWCVAELPEILVLMIHRNEWSNENQIR